MLHTHNELNLEIEKRKKFSKLTNTEKLKCITKQCAKGEITKKTRKYIVMNINEIKYQSLWDAAKAILKRRNYTCECLP